MEIKSGYTLTGERKEFLKMSYKKGLKHFESLGYSLCPNDKFMQKQIENKTIYVHFVGGNWLIENK